jgi:hypothetical protein
LGFIGENAYAGALPLHPTKLSCKKVWIKELKKYACEAYHRLSKNAYQAKAEIGVLAYKRVKDEENAKKSEGWLSLHFLLANFLRFMAANLSLTQFETWARPR